MKRGRWQLWKKIGAAILGLILVLLVIARSAGFGCIAGRTRLDTRGPANPELLEGNWSGTWTSDSTQMTGSLQCRIARLSDGTYHARFEAVFAKILTHTSEVTLNVQHKGDSWEFAGEKDLGLLAGGIYKYSGHSDGRDFVSTFDSKWDKGTFRMKRASSTTQRAAASRP